MRILFATTAGAGHLGPLVPFAAAATELGHDVVVAAPGSAEPAVRRVGLPFHAGRREHRRRARRDVRAHGRGIVRRTQHHHAS